MQVMVYLNILVTKSFIKCSVLVTGCFTDQEKVVNPSNLVASRILGWQ